MDNLTIQNHLRTLSGAGQLGQPPELNIVGSGEIQPLGAAEEPSGPSFKTMLTDSINKVNGLMNDSDQAVEDLASGKSSNVHHTMIALQKADISFRMLLEARNKVMSAYNEVMRMTT
jgi:flagellar hook-basal body complex protein FliE